MTYILEQAKTIFDIEDCTFTPVIGHEGGRNLIVIVSRNGDNKYVLRISDIGDRTEKDYLAETEFIQYLAENGAPVADVIPSVNGKLVEKVEADGKAIFVSLFAYAKLVEMVHEMVIRLLSRTTVETVALLSKLSMRHFQMI